MQDEKQMGPVPESPNQNTDPNTETLAGSHSVVYHNVRSIEIGRAIVDLVETLQQRGALHELEELKARAGEISPEAGLYVSELIDALLVIMERGELKQMRTVLDAAAARIAGQDEGTEDGLPVD